MNLIKLITYGTLTLTVIVATFCRQAWLADHDLELAEGKKRLPARTVSFTQVCLITYTCPYLPLVVAFATLVYLRLKIGSDAAYLFLRRTFLRVFIVLVLIQIVYYSYGNAESDFDPSSHTYSLLVSQACYANILLFIGRDLKAHMES